MIPAPAVARPLVDSVDVRVVSPDWAGRVVSPLHDVLGDGERRAILAENPDSYLHVTSDPLDLPDPSCSDGARSAQARALQRLLDLCAYVPVSEPGLFVYRLTDHGHEHTGLVAGVAVDGFRDGRVLGHERVQPERVAGLVRHHRRVQTRSELVTLFHRSDVEIADQTARIVTGPPILDFTDAGGVAQSIWRAGTSEAAALARQLGEHRLYVADGHHRVAAATRLARRGAARADTVLCALYPDDQLVLHAFHRHVRGPVDVPALLDGLASDFEVRASPRPGRPDLARGRLGLYAAHRWWTLRPRCPRRLPGVAGLDVTLLDQRVLRPLLDVGPADPRLRFVPDLHDLTRTTESCDSDGGVLLTLHAPRIEDIVSVAERREVMSPKSTYVLPKPRTGIFLG